MFKILPTRTQWQNWSLPSKLTCIGTYVGILSLLLFFVTLIWPQGSKNNQVTVNSNGNNNTTIGIVQGDVLLTPARKQYKEYSCGKYSDTACPLEVSAFMFAEPHANNSEYVGIKWESKDTDVRVFIKNIGKQDYSRYHNGNSF
jgi:hypothetical protein